MIDLNHPLWNTLSSAGPNTAELLKKLTRNEGDFYDTVDILAENLSHQLSWYDVTAYALPHLARLCRTLDVEKKLYLIANTGAAVAAESDASLLPDSEAFREFHEGLTALRQETQELLEHHMEQIKTLPDDLPQVFAVAALALLGNRSHALSLYLFAPWNEFPAMCSDPDCDWYEDSIDFSGTPETVTPGEPDEEGVWFGNLLDAIGDRELLPRLPYLYGTCTCPECGTSGPFWEWMLHAMEEA